MKKISRNTLLRNSYTSNDLAVAAGVLSLAGTPLSILWNKLKGYKVESYAAGAYSSISITLGGITALSNGAHRIVLKNTNPNAVQREIVLVVYGDGTATASEVAANFNNQVINQSTPNSAFQWVSFGGNVLVVQLVDATYADIAIETDITGLTSVITAATLPVGDVDAATLPGYSAAVDYDKYTFQEEGTYRDGNNDIPVLYEDVVYIDDTLTAMATDHTAVVVMSAAPTTVAGLRAYLQVPALP